MSTMTTFPPIAYPRVTAPRVPTTAVRLTRRGRVVVLVLALAVLTFVGLWWSATSAASDEATGYPTRTVVVAAGDTLWEIADDAAGSASTYDMVSELRSLNGLEASGLQAGQQLLVPLR